MAFERSKEAFLILIFVVLLVAGVVLFFQWRVGFVGLDFPAEFSVGDKLSGKLNIEVEEGDDVSRDLLILLSLSKDGEIIEARTFTFEDIVELSGGGGSDDSYYFEPRIYSVDIKEIMDYQFLESGKYELFLNIVELDFVVKKKFVVE